MGRLKLIFFIIIYAYKSNGQNSNNKETVSNMRHDTGILHAFTIDESNKMTELHNEHRASTLPAPSNMNRLTWDSRISSEARDAISNCSIGKKTVTHGVLGELGWNEYVVDNRNFAVAFMAWYNEKKNYDNDNSVCKANSDCSHYVQMMSAKTKFIGCYWNQCFKNETYLIGCGYAPKYDTKSRLYQYGKPPCTRCEGEDGGRCYKGLCATSEECKLLRLCGCTLKCENEGTLNKKTCKCNCKAGAPQTLDCSSNDCPGCGENGLPTPNRNVLLSALCVVSFVTISFGHY